MTRKWLKRAALLTVTVALLMVGAAAPALADDGTSQSVSCADTGSDSGVETVSGQPVSLLPVQRWASVPLHSRLPLNLDVTTWFPVMQQSTAAMNLGIGNAAWQVTAKVTAEASRFCIGDQVGRWLDQATGAMGKALISSGLVAGILIIAIVAVLWNARRNGGLARGLVKLTIVAAIMGAMIAGAAATTNSSFGKGSPGWWGAKVNDTVSAVASAPAAALNDQVLNIISDVSSDSTAQSDVIDCRNYMQALEWRYRHSYTNPSTMAATTATDAMWRSSGMTTWQEIQFGSNKWGPKVGCRLLEYAAGIPGSVQKDHTEDYIPSGPPKTVNIDGARSDSLAFSAITNDEIDQAMIGWAACTVNQSGAIGVEADWSEVKVTAADCERFFQQSKSAFEAYSAGSLNFTDNLSDNITRTASQPQIQDFVLHLHGNKTADQTGVLVLYIVASWLCAAVFAVLAGAVYVAKLGLVALGLFAVWVLLANLIKVNEDSSKVADLAKHYVTMAFFAFLASLLMTVVAMLTAVIHKVGASVSGTNSVSSAFWAGAAPVISVVLLNLFFTKLLKAPSPFKPTSALAWGAAAGGTGVVAGAGIERAATNRIRNAGTKIAHAGGRAVASKMGLGSGKRTGGMTPLGTAATVGAGAALGAGLAGHMKAKGDADSDDPDEQLSDSEVMEQLSARKARGGRDFTPTGNAFRDNMTDFGMRLEHRSELLNQRLALAASQQGRRALRAEALSAIGERVSATQFMNDFSKNPMRTAAKMAAAGAGVGASALMFGVPGAAIVGGGLALKKVHGMRQASAAYRAEHGGLTRHEFESRQRDLVRFRKDQERQADMAKLQALAAESASPVSPFHAGRGSDSRQDPASSDQPALIPLPPRPKMPQPSRVK